MALNVDGMKQVGGKRPLPKVAKSMGATTTRDWDGITHEFPDGTKLVVRGRGKSYKVEYVFE